MPRPGYYAGIVPDGAVRITEQQWRSVWMWGSAEYTDDGESRIRYIIAAALEKQAKHRRRNGRPDLAGKLTWLEGRIRTGQPTTKRVMSALRNDLEVVKGQLTSGTWRYSDA